jgi:hypothetical protein
MTLRSWIHTGDRHIRRCAGHFFNLKKKEIHMNSPFIRASCGCIVIPLFGPDEVALQGPALKHAILRPCVCVHACESDSESRLWSFRERHYESYKVVHFPDFAYPEAGRPPAPLSEAETVAAIRSLSTLVIAGHAAYRLAGALNYLQGPCFLWDGVDPVSPDAAAMCGEKVPEPGSFAEAVQRLDAMLTGKDAKTAAHTWRDQPHLHLPVDWLYSREVYYLSDGGYSRLGHNEKGDVWLTSESKDRVRSFWDQLAVLSEAAIPAEAAAVQDFLRQERARLACS